MLKRFMPQIEYLLPPPSFFHTHIEKNNPRKTTPDDHLQAYSREIKVYKRETFSFRFFSFRFSSERWSLLRRRTRRRRKGRCVNELLLKVRHFHTGWKSGGRGYGMFPKTFCKNFIWGTIFLSFFVLSSFSKIYRGRGHCITPSPLLCSSILKVSLQIDAQNFCCNES